MKNIENISFKRYFAVKLFKVNIYYLKIVIYELKSTYVKLDEKIK